MSERNATALSVVRRQEGGVAGWLVSVLAEIVQEESASIRKDVPLWEYGVDSLVVATLLAEIDDELGVWVDAVDLPPQITLGELATIVVTSMELEEASDVA